MDRYKLAKRWLLAINLTIASMAGAGASIAHYARASSQWLLEMVDAAKVFLPLDSWVSKSNFPREAQVYDLLALPLVVTSAAWFFALLYLPPAGSLGVPYTPAKRVMAVLVSAFLVLLAVLAPIVEHGQDVPLLRTGTSLVQLALFGWNPFVTVGLSLALSGVFVWKSITVSSSYHISGLPMPHGEGASLFRCSAYIEIFAMNMKLLSLCIANHLDDSYGQGIVADTVNARTTLWNI